MSQGHQQYYRVLRYTALSFSFLPQTFTSSSDIIFSRRLFKRAICSSFNSSKKDFQIPSESRIPTISRVGVIRLFGDGSAHSPEVKDGEIGKAIRKLMAECWEEVPNWIKHDTKKVLAKGRDDAAGKRALENVFRAAEAVEEFGGILVALRTQIDDYVGISGENAGPLPDEFEKALALVYERYMTYLDGFGADETYLRKKVETELGSKMIHLKMRCNSVGSHWAKVTVLGTSGLSGSYIEQRATT